MGTLDEFVADAYPKLAGWVRRQVGDDATAHAITSEAFVRLLSRWTKAENPYSCLHTTAAKLIRDHESSPTRVDDEPAIQILDAERMQQHDSAVVARGEAQNASHQRQGLSHGRSPDFQPLR